MDGRGWFSTVERIVCRCCIVGLMNKFFARAMVSFFFNRRVIRVCYFIFLFFFKGMRGNKGLYR